MKNILNVIPYGKENAISRQNITKLTGVCDRIIRHTVKELNKELVKHGEAILSSSKVRGYWRTTNIYEMKEYIREGKHRQQMLLKNDAPIQQLIYKTEGVRFVPVKAHFRKIEQKVEDENQLSF